MAVDAHANFAYSLVATAPSPASSGTSLVVTAADGAKMPAVPFNVTIWPTGVQPTTANAEIARCTARSTDTLTITRAQEGSAARTVVVGDQIAATITNKTLTDIEQSLLPASIVGTVVGTTYTIPGCIWLSGAAAQGWAINQLNYVPAANPQPVTPTSLVIENAAANVGKSLRVGVYNADAHWQPTSLIVDYGAVALDTTGTKTISGLSTVLPAGRLLYCYTSDVAGSAYGRTVAPITGQFGGSTTQPGQLQVVNGYAALAGTGVAWTFTSNGGPGIVCPFNFII